MSTVRRMNSSVCVAGGCGHVGLPLGVALANAGCRVTLLDTSRERVDTVSRGQMPFLEHGGEAALAAAHLSGRLAVTTDPTVLANHDVVIVTIGTPVDEYLDPSVRSFDRVMDSLLGCMRDGQLLVLRSTVFPGVSDRLARQAAQRGLRIDVAYCPERIVQGYAFEELTALPQLVGGTSETGGARAAAFFESFGVQVVRVSPCEAELAKLFANAHRYITFAISNQFMLISEKFGVNFNRVRDAVTAQYPRLAGFAKAGFTGGPCLLKDTMQLAAFNHNAFAIGQAAMMVNEGLPRAIIDLVKSHHDLTPARAAILGMAFKGNCDDPRSSLSYKLRKILTLECAQVLCTDPYVQETDFVPLEQALANSDIVFIGACHQEYRDLVIQQPVVDVFGFLRAVPNPILAGNTATVRQALGISA